MEHQRFWCNELAADTARRLTADKAKMNRIGRRKLARKRKFMMERNRLLKERRVVAIQEMVARWDANGDGARHRCRDRLVD